MVTVCDHNGSWAASTDYPSRRQPYLFSQITIFFFSPYFIFTTLSWPYTFDSLSTWLTAIPPDPLYTCMLGQAGIEREISSCQTTLAAYLP